MSEPASRDALLLELSCAIEARLVDGNPRGMRTLRRALAPGYCLRAARTLAGARRVIIGTGFPVEQTFETDGPPGAMALARALAARGADVYLACAPPIARVLAEQFSVLELSAFDQGAARREALERLAAIRPDAVVSIERPGLAADGRYYNMRGEDISERCAIFDDYFRLADCPTIAIGDGGNEIGMGRLAAEIAALAVPAAATACDELIVADVSNWGAYALVALLDPDRGVAALDGIAHRAMLEELAAAGGVDGVTRAATATEDGLLPSAGEQLIADLRRLVEEAMAAR
jgi:hypothetical protein